MNVHRTIMAPGTPAEDAGHPNSHCKPRLGQLLRTLRLDVTYERGAGSHLYFRDEQNREVEVLDLVGGYGSLLLGHSHPELVAEAQRLLLGGCPVHSQGSRHEYAQQLARELSARARGDYCVVFGNSGAEAVDAAMKHAMMETGSQTFVALERAFHGKTLGSLQLTANPHYREGFELPGVNVVRVPLNDLDRLDEAFAGSGDLAGFIFEPIQGEGGIRLMDPAFARRAAGLCRAAGVPLIADECQTGMGRTGTFLASETLGLQPDYIILSKSLGGGLAKISALLIRRARYRDEFDLKHTSTFAEDDFSCAIALKSLELIDDSLMAACREKGARLLAGLRALAARHPRVVAEVRGRGLLAAIEFRPLPRSASFLLRVLSMQEDLGYVISGHLLNRHRLRVAPTLSDPFTLRLEPPASISDGEINGTLAAFEEVCSLLERDDALRLTRFFTDGPAAAADEPLAMRRDAKPMVFDHAQFRARQRSCPEVKVAWLCHLVDAGDLPSLEPSFARMPVPEREKFLAHWVSRIPPVVMSSVDVTSALGQVVRFHPIMLPFTSGWVKRRLEAGSLAAPRALVQQGVDAAHALGCRLVSLGQYTSIVTLNGLRIDSRGLGVTTGNSYAIALAIQAVERACHDAGKDPRESTLVVAGASGNIGRTCAEILACRFRRTILIGSDRPGSLGRLQVFGRNVPNAVITTDLLAAWKGDVVVAATNAVDAPLTDECLAHHAIVCDLSVPASVRAEVIARRRDLVVIKGGIASLPLREDLGIVGFPLPPGQAYGCMAEAMVLGFEGVRDRVFTGRLTPDHVARISRMAAHHGFKLGRYKRGSVHGSDRKEVVYAGAC